MLRATSLHSPTSSRSLGITVASSLSLKPVCLTEFTYQDTLLCSPDLWVPVIISNKHIITTFSNPCCHPPVISTHLLRWPFVVNMGSNLAPCFKLSNTTPLPSKIPAPGSGSILSMNQHLSFQLDHVPHFSLFTPFKPHGATSLFFPTLYLLEAISVQTDFPFFDLTTLSAWYSSALRPLTHYYFSL